MTTVTLTLESVCPGGGHFEIRVAMGPRERVLRVTRESVLDSVTDDEIQTFGEVVLRIFAAGKSNNQIRTALLAGVEVVIP